MAAKKKKCKDKGRVQLFRAWVPSTTINRKMEMRSIARLGQTDDTGTMLQYG